MKKHYTDYDGRNVVHIYTPFTLNIDEHYDYLREGPVKTFGYNLFHGFAYIILRPLMWLYGVRFEGMDRMRDFRRKQSKTGKGYVTVINHVALLDCVMAACTSGFDRNYFVCDASSFCAPVIRHIIRWLGAVPVTHEPAQTVKLLSEMEKALLHGASVHINPEAVLVPGDRTIRPFERGAFLLAARCAVPVVPIVITWRKAGGLYRFFGRKWLHTVHILPPQFADPKMRERAASMELMKRVRGQMIQMSEKYRNGSA